MSNVILFFRTAEIGGGAIRANAQGYIIDLNLNCEVRVVKPVTSL